MAKITRLSDDALIVFDNLSDAASHMFEPTLRFGVTGLSRAGKTVFITSLIHNLLNGGRLPLFSAQADGRIEEARLSPQPDDAVPRFKYEQHLEALLNERIWPNSTSAISQIRLRIAYQSASTWNRTFGAGELTLDIIDYPGEWLLDLPLLGKSFEQWSAEALELSRLPVRNHLAKKWHEALRETQPSMPESDVAAEKLAATFTGYLRSCREDEQALSTLPPGRFLMPGDLEGSPALTFSPLDLPAGESAEDGTFHAMMARRFEAYKTLVVRPFFREHFARLDRQIVLVDALQALNAGPSAVEDLQNAVSDILQCFNPGKRSWLTSLFSTRTDRILFAATKADHLHHENHDRLEAILQQLVGKAMQQAEFDGAETDVVAMAAVRATTEAEMKEDGDTLPVIVGTPKKGERLGKKTFDGDTKTALFPGDLPENPDEALQYDGVEGDLRFLRFRPPQLQKTAEGVNLSLPHIRLDRALEFLIGDKLR
ncbi:YcjX family protein [Ahrensia sp. R2A130]|uniref:YcjX family protein n=1 Tax=Ahrensia sp. R2A130 TaxID=744979 RepID=UPI0001E0F061|nr:YcjX family protein [Ahrensia sp. R2A130]EFL90411.1 amino acid regulated cytosolic protein [Ahrensia sp. R2A130]